MVEARCSVCCVVRAFDWSDSREHRSALGTCHDRCCCLPCDEEDDIAAARSWEKGSKYRANAADASRVNTLSASAAAPSPPSEISVQAKAPISCAAAWASASETARPRRRAATFSMPTARTQNYRGPLLGGRSGSGGTEKDGNVDIRVLPDLRQPHALEAGQRLGVLHAVDHHIGVGAAKVGHGQVVKSLLARGVLFHIGPSAVGAPTYHPRRQEATRL